LSKTKFAYVKANFGVLRVCGDQFRACRHSNSHLVCSPCVWVCPCRRSALRLLASVMKSRHQQGPLLFLTARACSTSLLSSLYWMRSANPHAASLVKKKVTSPLSPAIKLGKHIHCTRALILCSRQLLAPASVCVRVCGMYLRE